MGQVCLKCRKLQNTPFASSAPAAETDLGRGPAALCAGEMHVGPVVGVAVIQAPGVHRVLWVVATDAARDAIHAAHVAHRARIWTEDEVHALASAGIDQAGAQAVAEARILFRARIVGVGPADPLPAQADLFELTEPRKPSTIRH